MKTPISIGACLLSGAMLLSAQTAWGGVAGPLCATGPCGSISAHPARSLGGRPGNPQLAMPAAPASTLAGGTLTLRGSLDGQWDRVDGHLVFPYDFSATHPSIGRLQVFLRGLIAQPEAASNRYSVQWDRSVYWLDFDGDGPAVPRFLPAQERSIGYVPAASNDPYPEFANEPAVVASCTPSQPCSIEESQFVLLREPGVDYSAYPAGAAEADLLFVSNQLGQAIAAVLDVYDANGQFQRTKDLVEDDQIQLSVIGHKLSEPDFVYLIEYTGFVTLDTALRIELDNYTPGVDFVDPTLPPDLNMGNRPLRLLLDAYRASGSTVTWGQGGPFDLGFTWSQALDFLHRSGFETTSPTTSANPHSLVEPR